MIMLAGRRNVSGEAHDSLAALVEDGAAGAVRGRGLRRLRDDLCR